MSSSSRVLIATHAVMVHGQAVHGPAHILFDYLRSHDIPARLVSFPLESGVRDWPRQVREIIRVAHEYRPTVYIGIDPLNGWAGRTLKRRGLVSRFVYHTPDYSPRRFGLAPLNALYHWIDRTVVESADDCWTVSSRITDVRKHQGRADARTIFNGIAFDAKRIPPFDAKRRYRLIMVGNLNQTMDLDMLLGVIAELKAEFPKIHLDIVGDGAGREQLEHRSIQLTVDQNITFHGNQPLERVLELLANAGVGIALYSGAQGFNYYGDSKKIREYSALGLPVLTTPVVANAKEIRTFEAGIVVEPSGHNIKLGLEQLLRDPAHYQRLREGAIRLARDTDLEQVLDAAFRSIGVLA